MLPPILESVLGSLTEGVVITDAEGRRILANEAAERIIGVKALHRDPAELPGLYGVYHPDRVTPVPHEQMPITRVLREGISIVDIELFFRNAARPQGVWSLGSAHPLRDAAGKITGAIGIFRDVTAARRDGQRTRMLYQVSRILADSASVADAMPAILHTVCEELDWTLGAVWMLDTGSDVLRCSQMWHRLGAEAATFEQRSRETPHQRGEGLPGMVWAGGEAVWLPEVSETLCAQRRSAATGLGLRSAIAFPIAFRESLLGIVEFFSRVTEAPDEGLRQALTAIGRQLAQALEREAGERAIHELNAELRQRAEELESKYRLAVKATNDAIWDWDCATGRCDFREGAAVFGYPPEVVPSDSSDWWADRLHPEDRQRILDSFTALPNTDKSFWQESYRFARRDGSYALVEDCGYVVRDASGRAVRIVGAMADVTARRRAEELLRSERDFIRGLVDTSPALIVTLDPEMRITSINQAALKTFRYRASDLIGKDCIPLMVPPEEHIERRALIQRMLEATEPVVAETVVLARGGEPVLVEWHAHGIQKPDGSREVLAVGIDVTQRRRTEDALRSERDFNRTMVEASPAFVVTLDPQWRVLSANQSTLKAAGYRTEDVLGKDYLSLFAPPEERDQLRGRLERLASRQDEPTVNTDHLLTSDGRRLFVEWHDQVIFKPDGSMDFLVGIGIDRTERKQAEDALRTSEARYRAIVEQASDLVSRYTPDFKLTFVNEAVSRFFGRPREDFLGVNFLDYMPEEDAEKVRQAHAQLSPASSNFTIEHRVTAPDGKVFWVQWTDQAFFGEDGRIIECQGVGRDVTARRQAEEELAHSLSVLKATLEATTEGILVVDSAGMMARYNHRFSEMWGLPDELLAGRTSEEAAQHAAAKLKNPEQLMARVRAMCTNLDAPTFDVLELKDGRIFERNSQPQRLDGRSVGRVVSYRDVTQQRRAEESLSREREFLKTLLESVSEGIIACDAEGRIIICNRAAREFHGVPDYVEHTREWPGLPELYHADAKTPLCREEVPLERAYRGEVFRNAEIVILHPGSLSRTALVHGDPIIRPSGERLGGVVVIHDVTQERHLQRQLLQSQKLESIGTLAGGIAHDFNNLLAVILGNASVHLRDSALPVRLRESLGDIVDAAERGSSLTHQLLAYARGGLQRLGPMDLNSVVDSVLRMLRRTAPPQIELQLELEPNLPRITADPSQMEQVVMNLALNAFQASCGPSEVRFSTSVRELVADAAAEAEVQPGSYVCLTVEDHGCGMDTDTVDRIFEPFFTTKPMGRGMGLAATLGIVKSHGGAIAVKSAQGEGTTFHVYLPPSAGAEEVRAAGPEPGPTMPARGCETVLIIDDDPAVTRAVGQMLSSLGYCVVEHTEVEEARAFLQTNGPELDLVILDLNLPKCSAEEMFEAVVKNAPSTRVLLASGHSEPHVVDALRERGAASFLHKPFTVFQLSTAVRAVLDGRE